MSFKATQKKYHLAVSYSSSDREYVEQIVTHLQKQGVRLFFDRYEEADTASKNVNKCFTEIFSNQTNFVLIFLSYNYFCSEFTPIEYGAAITTAKNKNDEYIIAVKLDNCNIDGYLGSINYIDARKNKTPLTLRNSTDIAKTIRRKLSGSLRFEDFFPENLDRFYKIHNPTSKENGSTKERCQDVLRMLFTSLKQMTSNERYILAKAVLHRCCRDNNENVHIHLDYLSRLTKTPTHQILEVFKGLSSLNFISQLKKNYGKKTRGNFLFVSGDFIQLKFNAHDARGNTNGTDILISFYKTYLNYCCESCIFEAIAVNDLSVFSSDCSDEGEGEGEIENMPKAS